jgi:hypothetical protein
VGLLSLCLSSFSQSIYETNKVVHRIGLHAGTTSGVGLSYKAVIKDKYQIQLTSLPYASADTKTAISGLNLMYKFVNNEVFDILFVVSAGHFFRSDITENYIYDNNYNYTITRTRNITSSLSSSVGIGFEIGGNDRFKFNCQAGYAVYDVLDNWQTLPSVAVGFDFLLSKKKPQ